jgi:hypothetical protein
MLKKFLLHVFLMSAFLQVHLHTVAQRPLSAQNTIADSVVAYADFRNVANWFVASVPRQQPALFPEASFSGNITGRVNCARIAWYIIDPLFYDKNTSLIPPNILNDPNARSGFYVNQVYETVLFPDRIPLNDIPVNLAVLNLAFYPGEKGLFNFDAAPGAFSAGIDSSGHLKNPRTRWGGMMRAMYGYNYKFIDFWLMDPFVESPLNNGGQFYIQLGDISEEILENGVLDVETGDRGYDNMIDEAERMAFGPYLGTIASLFGQDSPAYTRAVADPSGDKYHYFRGSDYDQQLLGILDRYKFYNGPEGNSTMNMNEPFPTIAMTIPNSEDINRNSVLDTVEAYFQYKIDLVPSALITGNNHITESRTVRTTFINGVTDSVRWFHFQIPINVPDTIIGNFSQIGSARFMRIFLKGFNAETHLRFATFELGYMKERTYKDMISVYPNPTQGPVTVDFDNRTPRRIMLYDHAGRMLRDQTLSPVNGEKIALDLSALSDGIYLLRLFTDQETVVKKVVVEK